MKKVVRTFQCDYCPTEAELYFCFERGCSSEREYGEEVPKGWRRINDALFCSLDCIIDFFNRGKRWGVEELSGDGERRQKFFERSE